MIYNQNKKIIIQVERQSRVEEKEKEYMPSLSVEEVAIIGEKFWLTTNRAKW